MADPKKPLSQRQVLSGIREVFAENSRLKKVIETTGSDTKFALREELFAVRQELAACKGELARTAQALQDANLRGDGHAQRAEKNYRALRRIEERAVRVKDWAARYAPGNNTVIYAIDELLFEEGYGQVSPFARWNLPPLK